jgi:uncharacterized protein YgiM (DUF1202 family)
VEQERSELHSGLGGSSFDAQSTFMFNCPYLGTLEDVDTSLSYPAAANHCFRTKSPASVELSHQEVYCLTDMHPGCYVFIQSVTTSPAVSNKKRVVKSNRRKQRVSIYALPLILILLFLAAILWWPAPGTTFQEAIAFGAALQGDIGEASDAGDGVLAGENGEPSQTEPTDAAVTTAEDQTAAEGVLPAASLVESSEAEQESPATAVQEDITSSNETAVSESQPEAEAAPVTASQAAEEAPIAAAAESTLPDVSQTSETTAAVAADETTETQDITATEAVEENEETAVVAEAVEVVETANEEAEESPALVIFDLPLIAVQLPAQNTALDQPAATSPDGERLALIGPDTSAPLALREVKNNIRSLFVRESPSLESELLTVITRRQQAALLGRDSSSAWFKVRLDTGVEGWVNAVDSQAGVDPSSLAVVGSPLAAGAGGASGTGGTAVSPVSTITAFPVVRSAIVNTGALNLRSGPGVAYEPITIINQGEIVGLLGRRGLGVWVRVRLSNGLEGWVNSSLLAPLS